MKKILLLSILLFGGCATTGTNVTQTLENNLPLIRTGASVATGAVLQFAVKDASTRVRLANEIYSSATAINSLATGKIPTVAELKKTLNAWGTGDSPAEYASYVQSVSSLYGAWLGQLQGNPELAVKLLTAISQGAQDGALAYENITSLSIQ